MIGFAGDTFHTKQERRGFKSMGVSGTVDVVSRDSVSGYPQLGLFVSACLSLSD